MEVHNFFPLLSPSVYFAAEAERVPVVQTLHNYRLLCPGSTFFRDGAVCEACTGNSCPGPEWRIVATRGSRTATAAVAAMVTLHKAGATWRDKVCLYITPTQYARKKFESRLVFHRSKLVAKSNFLLVLPGVGSGRGGFGLLVERSACGKKGIETLVAAWQKLGAPVGLKLVGAGPLMGVILKAAEGLPAVEAPGSRPIEEVYELMGQAAFLASPSGRHETLGWSQRRHLPTERR